ncbi:MAG: tetratricopeptide repeat protein, partial [Candidatus Omnitrophica bacterium]|nr:tetratricopeptide repeat protein [Candidatus Omnitrophota bacterium]
GLFYSDLKQYKRATRVFLRFVKRFRQNPKSQEAYFLLGYNLQLSGKYDKALEYYGKIASDDTGGKLFYAALKNTVLIYLNNGNEDKAEETLMRIITDFEKNDLETGTYIWLAERYLNKKRFKDVLNVIEKAEANNGLSQKAGEIAYLKAESERELGNLTEADKLYDVVLSSQDGDGYYAASHIGKGLCFVETGDFEKAKKEFEAAIETSPEDNAITIKARFEMANAESLSGHIEEAGKLYMLVDILYSDNYYCPESLLRAGKLFEKMGRKKEAVALYEEIINKYSKTHAAREAEERISNLAG